jgi:hypothetical protein
MASVASAMGMPAEDAAPLIARQPALLEIPPDSLAPQASRLAAALEVTLPGLLLMLSRATPPVVRSLLSTPAQVCCTVSSILIWVPSRTARFDCLWQCGSSVF